MSRRHHRTATCALVLTGAACAAAPATAAAQADTTRRDTTRRDTTRRDTTSARRLPGVTVRERAAPGFVGALPDVGGPAFGGSLLAAGAKSEVVQVAGSTANLAEKTGRQLFAQVPGVFVYDMDGAGNQLNVSTRGLDPHRSWELNVRQDGVVINSDLYGYPASHYSLALEGVERVALVRGTAALQYGSQFGGVLDYVTRSPDTTRAAAFESRNTVGSYGLLSTYNAVGGGVGRLTYLASASGRRSDGYRQSAHSDYDAELVRVGYRLTPTLGLRAQVGRSAYTYQIPGPLTDSMFAADPRAATRSRNYFRPDITVPSLTATWTPSAATRVTAQASGLFGRRNSVQVPGFATAPDLPNAAGQYSNRQVDVDRFGSTTTEVRVLHQYALGSRAQTLAAGVTVSANRMRRQQIGKGTAGDAYDIGLVSGTFARDLTYTSRAVAVYAEQAVAVTPRWTVVPGARVEQGDTRMAGRLAYYDPADTPRRMRHDFPLFGVRTAYKSGAGGRGAEFYGGWAQSYRPQILKDALPESAIERTDPDLRDSRGYTVEGGARGTWRGLNYDVGGYAMRVGNRFGTVIRTDPATGQPYIFKTNLGTTLTRGLELRADAPLAPPGTLGSVALRAFTAAALVDATYRGGSVADGGVTGTNRSVRGNKVEGVPDFIGRGGVTAAGPRWTATLLTSHTAASFADPLNTVAPTPNGARGRVPAYTVLDLDGGVAVTSWLRVGAGVSNLGDAHYFTKRPTFYPGPGVWPSDGRTARISVDITR